MVIKSRMKAVYDCTADEPGEISFKEGDILVDVAESNEEGWYTGRIENTTIKGLFPYNYVVPLSPNPAPKTDPLGSFPSLDAFEASIKAKPTTTTTTTTIKASNNNNNNENNIGLGIKMNTNATFEMPKLKSVSNRSRSFSASVVENTEQTLLKPSQLKNKSTLSKKSPKPPSNLRTTTQDAEEEDGFQILKPSQTRQKQAPSTKLDTIASTNPMPRLPSRPTSNASRKARKNQTSITVITPPVLKPKPTHPGLPPRPKARSSSNPPPIQPKPNLSSIEILLNRNNKSSTTPPPITAKKPVLPSKPPTSTKPKSAPGLPIRPTKKSLDENIKPSVLRARSATNPIHSDWTSIKPTLQKPIENGSPVKKATPPPPPPSRPPKSATKHRYEALFDNINDDGYVDGETAQLVWVKSMLSNEDLARIWRECDPDHKGLLDKHAFMDGMSKIDDLLFLKQQAA